MGCKHVHKDGNRDLDLARMDDRTAASAVTGRVADEKAQMIERVPTWAVWCIAAVVNALIWTGLVSLGMWLVGSPASVPCLLAGFIGVTAFGLGCQLIVRGGSSRS